MNYRQRTSAKIKKRIEIKEKKQGKGVFDCLGFVEREAGIERLGRLENWGKRGRENSKRRK